ncbi:sugar O-acetyltransferase [Alkalicoccus urumqiensis]|uniref:Acetyltransferase n=1 Tax=Alkalicoccus urumqiensis TaxID=1548213 RepID=A0A2P6MJ25_ALKUR|nr:sugar O-acetyltransferase [Alkalicoccus urumqiensis]PRO66276.1 acetyltransferase [Alkalicoccus urumqiensis]
MTEKEKMLAGMQYNPACDELSRDRFIARRMSRQLHEMNEEHTLSREELLREILGSCGESIYVENRFQVDYGYNVHAGDRFYANFDCVLLDAAPIRFGNDVMLAPGVHIYTASHPLNKHERRTGLETALPVTVGSDVWIGGGAVINPGVTIGDGAVIASGAVVTKDIPPDTLAAGVPAEVIRTMAND